LDKSILDLPAYAESGACPISASTNQALTCLIREPAILRPTERPNESEVPQVRDRDLPSSQSFKARLGRAAILRGLSAIPDTASMIEQGQVLSRIADLSERVESLRGYL